MSNEQTIQTIRILQKYPQAKKIKVNELMVGDVLCNHVDVPCLYVTEEIKSWTKDCDLDYFWLVARCGCDK